MTDREKVLVAGFIVLLFFMGIAIGTSVAIAEDSSSESQDSVCRCNTE
jgi:hypothetical protein